MESPDNLTLGVVDYIIVLLMLVISAGIGVYFRFTGGRQKTTGEFLMAGKNMSIMPVAFSLMASFLSSNTAVGVPAEMYKFGTHQAFLTVGWIIGIIISSYIFLPVFFNLQVYSVNEYLERRFGKTTRILASLAFVTQMILYMSVVLYSPSIALSAVTGVSQWVSIATVGIVCTFYCTIGGMKAVIWTDVFQSILMYIGVFIILGKGTIANGGMENIFNIASDGDRLQYPRVIFDFTTRYTFWNILIQGITLGLNTYGTNQVQVQRLLTINNLKKSRWAIFLSLPLSVLFHASSCLLGVIIYARYADCDPVKNTNNVITENDQLVPYFIMTTLSSYPGLPGLCISGIFSASLSTVSSAVNSLSAVTLEDFVRPHILKTRFSEKRAPLFVKIIALFYGCLCMALTLVVATFTGVVQASLTLFGMMAGPLVGLFILGMFTTRTNERGSVIGIIVGIAFSAWISFGPKTVVLPLQDLPVSTSGCYGENSTLSLLNLENNNTWINMSTIAPTSITLEADSSYVFPLYRISYMWYSSFACIATIIVGYFSSIITGPNKSVEPELLSPIVRRWFSPKQKNEPTVELKSKVQNGGGEEKEIWSITSPNNDSEASHYITKPTTVSNHK